MAKVKDNIVTEGLSGKLGKRLVFRRSKGGKTIVSLAPVLSEDRQFSDAQMAQQEAFTMASEYARGAKTHPVYVRSAKGTDLSAYNAAMADWFGKPEVVSLDVTGYTGQPGQTILVKARDDTKVAGVRMIIHDNGTILEQGEALPSETDSLLWVYTTTSAISFSLAPIVDANAVDLAGNVGAWSAQMHETPN